MLVYSKNNFFINGLFFLNRDLNFFDMNDYIFFDLGNESVVVINKFTFNKLQKLDPIIVFMLCRKLFFFKSINLHEICQNLREHTADITNLDVNEILTPIEAKVMSLLCTHYCPREVSIILGLNEKRVSAYKLKVLRKFGFKNTSLFFIEYFLWLNSWRDLMNLTNEHHQCYGLSSPFKPRYKYLVNTNNFGVLPVD